MSTLARASASPWPPAQRRGPWTLALLGLLLALCALWAAGRGAYGLPLRELPPLLWGALGRGAEAARSGPELVFFNIRLPRLLLGVAAGAGLGMAGALMQGLFRNPLADPGLIGVSSGAALAAGATIVLGATWFPELPRALGSWPLVLMAFAGGHGPDLPALAQRRRHPRRPDAARRHRGQRAGGRGPGPAELPGHRRTAAQPAVLAARQPRRRALERGAAGRRHHHRRAGHRPAPGGRAQHAGAGRGAGRDAGRTRGRPQAPVRRGHGARGGRGHGHHRHHRFHRPGGAPHRAPARRRRPPLGAAGLGPARRLPGAGGRRLGAHGAGAGRATAGVGVPFFLALLRSAHARTL